MDVSKGAAIKRIVIANSKGGTGKSTIAVTLANFYALSEFSTTIIDHDPQGSSSHWASKRAADATKISCIKAYQSARSNKTQSWFLKPPSGTRRVIVDTPSGLEFSEFRSTLSSADAIVVPVTPSSVDIHASTRFIAELLLNAKEKRRMNQIAVVANRCKKNTIAYRQLEQFLRTLNIPFLSSLRDTQNYVKTIELGSSIFESNPKSMMQDIQSWGPIVNWLEATFEQNELRRSG